MSGYRRPLSQQPLQSLECPAMSEHPERPPADDEPPKVYHPQAADAPSYDEYADPAVAHGWQNTYDETRELPPVGAGEQPTAEMAVVPVAAVPGAPPAARSRPGRGARRKPSAWRTRRAAVAAGAVGAVGAAALIVGFSFSGSSADGSEDRRDPSGVPSAEDTDAGAVPDADASDGAGSRTPSRSPSPSPSATEGAADAGDDEPSSGATTATAPATSTAPTTAPPAGGGDPGNGDSGGTAGSGGSGTDDKPGNGHGRNPR